MRRSVVGAADGDYGGGDAWVVEDAVPGGVAAERDTEDEVLGDGVIEFVGKA